MIATSYVGCKSTNLAVALFSLALGSSNLNTASYTVNHLDIAPRFSGVLMGITNAAGTIPGIIGPYVVGLLTDNQVCCPRNGYVLYTTGGLSKTRNLESGIWNLEKTLAERQMTLKFSD